MAAAVAGGFQADSRDCIGFLRVGVEVGCAGSGVESFFGKIFAATLATNEMAEPLHEEHQFCLLIVRFGILDGLRNSRFVHHQRTYLPAAMVSTVVWSAAYGAGSDWSRNR